jgi:methylmalonyl-CoA carboxyltransferase large subunit
MTTTPTDVAKLIDLVEELQRRVVKLERELTSATAARGPVPIDTILAISAAVAAYLGKKATVRQIHYSHSNSWARSGRSAIHASHTFTHTRSH